MDRCEHKFEQIWNFPNCLGVMDRKHIVIQAPANGGSIYFNYKGYHSIVLMAVLDAHYRFILVDISDAGHQSDGGVFANYDLGEAIENQTLHIPRSHSLPRTSVSDLLYGFVGDEGFPLKEEHAPTIPRKELR